MIPTWEELERHKKIIPEIDPPAVIAMLGIKEAGEAIQQSILDVLQEQYHLSEGKFCTLIVLHQHPEGVAPSELSAKIGVTRASISTMMHKLEEQGLVEVGKAEKDGRAKRVGLTEKGRAFMNEILPPHYLRITQLMDKLSGEEQRELIRLLSKLAGKKIGGENGE